MSHHPEEDPRYAALRKQFPKRTWLMFFGFFQLQGLLIGLLSLPIAFACANPSPGIGFFEIAGVLLWLVAIGGESIADMQLALFKAQPASKGRVCDFGLWKYSRHPNYFFEWVVWIAYFVFALGSPWAWVGLASPLLMLFFLTRMTGIPPAEARALASRGDAYRDYQRRTSAFIPWFPKS
jgi:steroid 5-alpha reductase family enzyme